MPKSSFVFIYVLILVSAGQAAPEAVNIEPHDLYEKIEVDEPEVGVQAQVYMGDQLLNQRSGMYVDCIIPEFEVQAKKFGGWTLLVKKGIPVCKDAKADKHYNAPYPNGLQKTGTKHNYSISLKEKKGKFRFCLSTSGMNAHCEKNLAPNHITKSTNFVVEADSFQQTIEYNGKRGSILKFVYSEFKNRVAREAFTREFEVDLSEGNVIAYKGAVLEVLEANNASITYKVVRHFPD